MFAIPRRHKNSFAPLIVASSVFAFLCINAQAATFTVTNTANAGAGTLRQAILDANANILSTACVPSAPFNDPGGFIFMVPGSTTVKNVSGPVASIAAARAAIAGGSFPPSPSGPTDSMLLWDANNSVRPGQYIFPSLMREFPIEANPQTNANNYSTGAFGKFKVDLDANGNSISGETILITFGIFSDDRSQLRIVGQDFLLVINASLQNISGDDALTADFLSGNSNSYGTIMLTEGVTYDFEAYHTDNTGASGLDVMYALGDQRNCFTRATGFPLVDETFRCAVPVTVSSQDIIAFNIAGVGVQTITPTSLLPAITDSVLIDGLSQPGATATSPLIQISGNLAGATNGLTFSFLSSNSEVRGLVINQFSGIGLQLANISLACESYIHDNFIGVDPAATSDLGNTSDGIRVDSAMNLIENNLVAGNNASGISVPATGIRNTIRNNSSGTNLGGTAVIPNNVHGIDLRSLDNLVEGNLSSGNLNDGILLNGANNNIVRNNRVGVNATATAALGNARDGISIGNIQTLLIDGNIISGNGRNGIFTFGSGTNNTFVNNKIGTDSAGMIDLGNGQDGILFQTGGHAVRNNLISGNSRFGLRLSVAGVNVVVGNTIGADITGTQSLGNTLSGVDIFSGSDNRIGGQAVGEANLIAFNFGPGISISNSSPVRNAFLNNSIFSNALLGIDLLNNNSVKVNDNLDADTGPNGFQNFPEITAHRSENNPNLVTVEGTLHSLASTSFLIQVFSSLAPDPSGFGEGQFFDGDVVVTTDASGNASFEIDVDPFGQFLTSTATRISLNSPIETSEFSAVFALDFSAPTVTIITPANNATYSVGQVVLANYFCVDALDGSGIATCAGNVPNGSPIDTSTPGAKSFTVVATDNFGNVTSVTHTYHIQDNSGGRDEGGGGGGSILAPNPDVVSDIFPPPLPTPTHVVPTPNVPTLDDIPAETPSLPPDANLAPRPPILESPDDVEPDHEDAAGCQTTNNATNPGLFFCFFMLALAIRARVLCARNALRLALPLGVASILYISVAVHAATFTVTTTANAGAGSLRQAILDANSNIITTTCVPSAPFNNPGGFIFLVPGATTVKNVAGATTSLAMARAAIAGGSFPPSPSGITDSMLLWDENMTSAIQGFRIYPTLMREFPIEANPVVDENNYSTGAFGKLKLDTDANANGILGETILVTFGMFSDDRGQLRIIGQDFLLTLNATLENLSGDDALTIDAATSNSNSYGTIMLTEGVTYDFEAYHTEDFIHSEFLIFYSLGDKRGCFTREEAFPLVDETFRCASAVTVTNQDIIAFNIAAPGVQTISPTSTLPPILDRVLVDGLSQPGATTTAPLIELSGNLAGAANGLDFFANSEGSEVRGLIVNRFSAVGIYLRYGNFTCDHHVHDNFLGVDPTGMVDLGNGNDGIRIESGSNLIENNLASGNQGSGIDAPNLNGIRTIVRNNLSGVNATGTAALGNSTHGIEIRGTLSVVEDNLSSGNTFDGIVIASTTEVTVRDNLVGVDKTGTIPIGNSRDGIQLFNAHSNLVENNLFSANRHGMNINTLSTNNLVINNKFGTDITGTIDLGNLTDGIQISAGANTVKNNLISGNNFYGIELVGGTSIIIGNTIGADSTGAAALANTLSGVHLINAADNKIGGTAFGDGNIIAFNAGPGISIVGNNALRNAILTNAIFSNQLLGIDLVNDDSIQINDMLDADAGPNGLQNFPIITMASRSIIDPSMVTVEGSLHSLPSTSFLIQFFTSVAPDPSGHGEGQSFVGEITVTTDANGNVAFAQDVDADEEFLTATASRINVGLPVETSEFSAAFEMDLTPPIITLITPPEGAVYALNEIVLANYFCTDDVSGSGIASCIGNVPNGSAIDTSTPGTKTFTVIATDNFGNTTTLTHMYFVLEHARVGAGGGSIQYPAATIALPPLLDDVDDEPVEAIPPPPPQLPEAADKAPSSPTLDNPPETDAPTNESEAPGCQSTTTRPDFIFWLTILALASRARHRALTCN